MSDDVLRELGKQLPYERPDAERREAVRSALLVAATRDDPEASRRRWLLVGGGFAAGALAAAAIAFLVVAPRARAVAPSQAHARVEAPATAQLEHVVMATTTGTDEIVRIRAGVVHVVVPAVRAGDRVRTQTADAEVEGTGSYEVVVAADHLERVTVRDGRARVQVRVDGRQQQVFLAAGQTWRSTVVTADVELPPARPPANEPVVSNPAPGIVPTPVVPSAPRLTSGSVAPIVASRPRTEQVTERAPALPPNTERMPAVTERAPASPPPPGPGRPSATEQHFQTGWRLLRDGKARAAALELGLAADANPTDPLAADARYFQAVALVRAGGTRDAERVLVAFLDHAPSSLRRGRAAILLGKLIRDRGDTAAARAWFEAALGDGDPAIVAAARAHLGALSPVPQP